jgi:hypothetical protein
VFSHGLEGFAISLSGFLTLTGFRFNNVEQASEHFQGATDSNISALCGEKGWQIQK